MGKPLPPIMGDSKKSSTPTSEPSSSTSPSPAPADNGGSGMKMPSATPGVLLGLSGGYLLVRMFLFGGALEVIEAIAILIADGFVCAKGDKGQKNLATLIIGFTALNLLFPGIIPWIREFREAQLNPPAPVEQVAPPAEEAPPSTERMVWAGRKKILAGDGEYFVPKGKKSLCITALGLIDGSTLVPQDITIGEISYSTLGSKCKDLPDDLEGKVIVDFSPGKPWGTKEAILNIYKEYNSKPGGIGQFPFIAIGM